MKCLQGETEWSTPISHFVDQQPDHIAYSDACFKYGMGEATSAATPWYAGAGRSVGTNSTLKLEKASTDISENVSQGM
jgi:hypothetical protein